MKLRLLSALCAVILFLSAGCQSQNASSSQTSQSAQTQEDEVIAEVGNQKIMYSQLAEQMVTLEAMYSGLSDQLTEQQLKEKLHTAALESLENLIAQQILYCKIDEHGIALTENEETEAQKTWDETLEAMRTSVQNSYPDLQGEDLEAMVQEAIDAIGLK